MAPRSALDADKKSRGYNFELTPAQEREVELVMERLGLWRNKKSFLNEAVNEKVTRSWGTIATRDTSEAGDASGRPRSVHDVEGEPDD